MYWLISCRVRDVSYERRYTKTDVSVGEWRDDIWLSDCHPAEWVADCVATKRRLNRDGLAVPSAYTIQEVGRIYSATVVNNPTGTMLAELT